MDINTFEKKIDFSIRLFSNDLEHALIHKYDTLIRINDSLEIKKAELSLIKKYVHENFNIWCNKVQLPLALNNYKIEDELIWLYFHSNYSDGCDSLSIRNMLLLDMYFDQKNLLIVNVNGKESGFTFNNKQKNVQLKL